MYVVFKSLFLFDSIFVEGRVAGQAPHRLKFGFWTRIILVYKVLHTIVRNEERVHSSYLDKITQIDKLLGKKSI